MDCDTIRMTESRWHKIYIGLQSILGQLKVSQQSISKVEPAKAGKPGSSAWGFFRRAHA